MEKSNYGLFVWAASQMILIVLKLTKSINGSWPIVLIPLWVFLAICFLIFLILYVVDNMD